MWKQSVIVMLLIIQGWTENKNVTARVPPTSPVLKIVNNELPTVSSASSLTSNLNFQPTSISTSSLDSTGFLSPNTTTKSVIIVDKYRSDKAFPRMNKDRDVCDCSYMIVEGNERAVVAVLGLLSLLCIMTTVAGTVLLLYPSLLHSGLQRL